MGKMQSFLHLFLFLLVINFECFCRYTSPQGTMFPGTARWGPRAPENSVDYDLAGSPFCEQSLSFIGAGSD